MDKIQVSLPVVVEGKYDKIKLSSVIDAQILTTEGFGIFNNREKRALLRRLSQNGLIVLTDSDGGGKLIRSHLSSVVAPEKLYHLYIPKIPGKERRKKTPSKEGTLGVEGVDAALLAKLFAPFANGSTAARASVTKADLYADGLTGTPGSTRRRRALCRILELPEDMTPTALLSAINLLLTEEEYRAACNTLPEAENSYCEPKTETEKGKDS